MLPTLSPPPAAPGARLRETDDARFAQDLACAGWVLVKFTGAWCPPCRALQPTLEKLCHERPDVQVLSLDVDAHPALAQRYGVRALPTLIAFRGGAPAGQLVGNVARSRIDALLGG